MTSGFSSGSGVGVVCCHQQTVSVCHQGSKVTHGFHSTLHAKSSYNFTYLDNIFFFKCQNPLVVNQLLVRREWLLCMSYLAIYRFSCFACIIGWRHFQKNRTKTPNFIHLTFHFVSKLISSSIMVGVLSLRFLPKWIYVDEDNITYDDVS